MTHLLIDYYRKTDKANSVWVDLIEKGYSFVIFSITKYELYSGAAHSQIEFWNSILTAITVIPFDENCVDTAVQINASLKRKRKQIDLCFFGQSTHQRHLKVCVGCWPSVVSKKC